MFHSHQTKDNSDKKNEQSVKNTPGVNYAQMLEGHLQASQLGAPVQMKESTFENDGIGRGDKGSSTTLELGNQNDHEFRGHGVTNNTTIFKWNKKNGKEKNKFKELSVPANKVVTILKDEGGILQVEVEVDGVLYGGVVNKNAVNITPENIEDLKLSTRNDIVRQKSHGLGIGNAAKDCNIHYGQELPKDLYSFINTELDNHMAPGQRLSVKDKTITLPIQFHNLEYITGLSDNEKQKYSNKTYAYRFTRFNNGNTKDIILVEELGVVDNSKKLPEEEIERVEKNFLDYNLSFVEPDQDAQDANTELVTKVNTNEDPAEVHRLHAHAYIPLSAQEKNAIYFGISKLSDKVLNDIRGLTFGKKSCKMKSAGTAIAEYPNAYYSSDTHEVILVSAGTALNNTLFGDKGDENFINRMEFTVLHEIGHAADYKPFRNEVKEDLEEQNVLFGDVDDKKCLRNTARKELTDFTSIHKRAPRNSKIYRDYLKLKSNVTLANQNLGDSREVYSNFINSLVGEEYVCQSGAGVRRIAIEGDNQFEDMTDVNSEFKCALEQDLPNITEYSNKGLTDSYAEAFALYYAEPSSLKALSPNVYSYFEKVYPQTEQNE